MRKVGRFAQCGIYKYVGWDPDVHQELECFPRESVDTPPLLTEATPFQIRKLKVNTSLSNGVLI